MKSQAAIRVVLFALCLVAVALFATACADTEGDDDDDTSFGNDATGPGEPVPADGADDRPGPTADGRIILPNGRVIVPGAVRATVQRFPLSVAASPDGNYLYVATTRTPTLHTLDAQTLTILNQFEIPNHFGGMAVAPDGSRLWVGGGGSNVVMEYDVSTGIPTLVREIPAAGFPTNVVVSADGSTLYVALGSAKTVAIYDTGTGERTGSLITQNYPYGIALDEAHDRAVVTCWGTKHAIVFALSTGERVSVAAVGKNPEGVAIAGGEAFVAASDDDRVTVLSPVTGEVLDTIPLYPGDTRGLGAFPTSVSASPDGSRVYVAASGFNDVEVIDTATHAIVGRVPTEWYPTAVLAAGGAVYVANAKGDSVGEDWAGSNDTDYAPHEGHLFGSVQVVDIPGDDALEEMTKLVDENNSRTASFYEDLDFDSPIPTEEGKPSDRIKHVVFILKENKTFDQLMGDFHRADAHPGLVMFGKRVTPNLHALAGQYALADNFYSEAEVSLQGHMWATAATTNDYMEKAWLSHGWLNIPGVEPASRPASRFFYHKLIEHGVDFRIYGEATGTLGDMELLAPYMDFNYGFFTTEISDRIKAKEVIREFEAGIFPSYIYIILPCDHTAGTTPGAPVPDYYVADNDAGLGMIVDWITKSEYWKDTVIFITQDDPQTGADHIDPHRTPLTVVSPWVKHNYTSPVQASMGSLFLTMELILGVPPMNDYDRFTAPLYDLFTTDPILDTFTALPSNVPYSENPPDDPMAAYSMGQDWDVPDQVDRLGEVLWANQRRGTPFPAHLSIDPAMADDEDEHEDAREFAERIEAYTRYGHAHGLFSPDALLQKGLWVDTEPDGAWRVFRRPTRAERARQWRNGETIDVMR